MDSEKVSIHDSISAAIDTARFRKETIRLDASYLWEIPADIEMYRSRPAERFLMTAVGGFFPVIARLPNGRVGAVIREGDGPVGQRGWLSLIVSDDEGESWSASRRIAGGQRDPAHHAFGSTGSGRLLLCYTHPHAYVDGGFDRNNMPIGPVIVKWSDDGGDTWSEGKEIDTSSIPAPLSNPYGRILQLPNGVLLLSIYVNWPVDGKEMTWADNSSRTYGAYVLRSQDNGLSWGDASLISRGNHNETALARLPSGKLLAAMRRFAPENGDDVWTAESHDEGYTWSDPVRVTRHHQHPSDLVPLADGRVLLVFGHREAPFGVRGLISKDEGLTWEVNQMLTLASEGITPQSGYPSAIALDDDRVLVAYHVARSPGPFIYSRGQITGPYAAAIKFGTDGLP